MYAQLGDIVFQRAFGANAHEVALAEDYAEHKRINSKPRLQRTGSALDEIKIGMKLHVMLHDIESVERQLESYMREGAVLRYIDGTGKLKGVFVIVAMKIVDAQWLPNGKPWEKDVEITLRESPTVDVESAAISAAIAAGFAMTNNSPVETVVSITPLTVTALAASKTVEFAAGHTNVGNELALAQGDAGDAAFYLNKAKTTAAKMQDAATEAVTAVNMTVGDIYDRTRQFEAAAVAAVSSVADFIAACETGELLDAVDAFVAVTGSNASLLTTSEILSELQGSRLPVLTNG